jgi:hypothetical protein
VDNRTAMGHLGGHHVAGHGMALGQPAARSAPGGAVSASLSSRHPYSRGCVLGILSFTRSAVLSVTRGKWVSHNQPIVCWVRLLGRTFDRRVLPGGTPSGGGGTPIHTADLEPKLLALDRRKERTVRAVAEMVSDRRAGWSNRPRLGDVDGPPGIRSRSS